MKMIIVLCLSCFILTGCRHSCNLIQSVLEHNNNRIEQINNQKKDGETITNLIMLSNPNLWDQALKKEIMINGFYESTFRYACENGTPDFAYYLIDHGMDINYVDSNGENEIMYLNNWVYKPLYEKLVTKLVKNNCNINATDKSDHTVLENAISGGDHSRFNECEEYMKLNILLDNGAIFRRETISVICENHYSFYSPLRLLSDEAQRTLSEVVPENCLEAVFLNDLEYLYNNLKTSKISNEDATIIIFYTAALGKSEDLEKLSDILEVPYDCTDQDGNSLLMAAAAAGNNDTFFYLKDRVPHDTVSKSNQTLLTAAISGYNDEILQCVFRENKNLWAYDISNNPEILERYSQLRNTLVFCRNINFITDFMNSVKLSDSEKQRLCNELILKNNMAALEVLLKMPEMEKLLDDADVCENMLRRCYNPDQVKTIFLYVPDKVKEKMVVALSYILDRKPTNVIEDPVLIIREFIAEGVDINQKHSYSAAILAATENGDTESVKELIRQNADVNVVLPVDGRTALMMAAIGDIEILNLLIQNGADVNATDNTGNTALRYAVGWSSEDSVRILLDHGIDKTIVFPDSPSLYDIAKEKGDKEIMELLK